MQKDFDKWNIEKKVLDNKKINRNLFFHTKEIWWCNAGLNIGVEANGKNENFERPMLIIKKFNSEMLWILPLTTKEKLDKYHYKINSEHINSWAILTQIKTISTKRLIRKLTTISDSDYFNIINKIQNLLKIESPLAGAFSEAEATNISIINQK
jgi:mRNA interferase MazF